MKEIKVKLSIDNLEQAKKEINNLCAKDRKIKIDVDTQGITKSINNLNQSVINLQKQLGIRTVFNVDTDTSNKGMKEISGSIQKITQELNSMSGRGFQELQARANELLQTTNQIAKTDFKVDKDGNLQKAIITYTNEMGQLSKETMAWVTKLDEAGNKTQVFEVIGKDIKDNAQAIQKATQNLETFKATMSTKLIKLEEMGFDTAKLEEFRNKLNSLDLTTTNVQYGILRDAIREATTEMSRFSATVDKAKASMNNTLEGIQNLRQLEGLRTANVEKLAQQVNSISTKSSQVEIDALQQKVNNLDKSTQQVIKLKEAQSQLSGAIKSVSSLEFIKGGEETKVKQATQSLEDMQKAMKSISQGKPMGDVDFTKLTNGAKGLSTELQNIANKAVKTQEQVAKAQQTLQNTLSKSMTKGFIDDSVFKNLQNRINGLNIKNFSAQIAQLTNDINSLSKVDSAIMRVQNAIETLNNKIKAVQNTSDNSEQSINAIKLAEAEIQKLQGVLTQLKTTGKLDGKNLVDSQQISSQINTIRNSVNSYLTDVQKANTNAKLKIDISDAQAKLDAFKNNSFFNGYYITKLQSKLNSLNTDTPEQEVKSLQKEINNLSSTATTIGRLETQYKKLATAIKSATSSGVFKADPTELNNAEATLRKLRDTITQLKTTGKVDGSFVVNANTNKLLNEATTNTKTLETAVKTVQSSASGATTQMSRFGGSFKDILGAMGIFVSVQTIMRNFFNSLKEGIQDIKELDTAMRDLRKVAQGTEEQLNSFTSVANEMAKEVGASTDDIIKATEYYSKLGQTLDVASESAKNATIFKNIGDFDSIEEASKALITIQRAFKQFDSVDNAEAMINIMDVANEVGNKFSSTSEDIAEGLERCGNAMNAAGNTYEETVGVFVAANDSVQNAEKVGNGIKTISMRLRGMKTELDKTGVPASKVAEEIKLITKNTSKMVDIYNADGSFKSTYQILEELSNVYYELDDNQQAYLQQILAGAQQGKGFPVYRAIGIGHNFNCR